MYNYILISRCQGYSRVIKVIQFLPVYIIMGSSWYKTHIAWEILVFYAIYMATRPWGFALVLVPVYFIKHSVSCYIYYMYVCQEIQNTLIIIEWLTHLHRRRVPLTCRRVLPSASLQRRILAWNKWTKWSVTDSVAAACLIGMLWVYYTVDWIIMRM